jgi:uncharacterized membrane protein YjfL (UPF0719 family)
MNDVVTWKFIMNSIVFSFLGIFVFVVGFVLIDILTPKVQIWKEVVEKQNIAVAVLMGSVALGIAQIIAAAIHG